MQKFSTEVSAEFLYQTHECLIIFVCLKYDFLVFYSNTSHWITLISFWLLSISQVFLSFAVEGANTSCTEFGEGMAQALSVVLCNSFLKLFSFGLFGFLSVGEGKSTSRHCLYLNNSERRLSLQIPLVGKDTNPSSRQERSESSAFKCIEWILHGSLYCKKLKPLLQNTGSR